MGAHDIGAYGWRWLAVDLVWAVAAGLGVGTICGAGIGKLVLYLRRVHREAVGLDEFLALGLIALSYGIALLIHAYGFLAVFAAGLSVRRIERQESDVAAPADVEHAAASSEEQATDPGPPLPTWRVLFSASTSSWSGWVKWRSFSWSEQRWRTSRQPGQASGWPSACSW